MQLEKPLPARTIRVIALASHPLFHQTVSDRRNDLQSSVIMNTETLNSKKGFDLRDQSLCHTSVLFSVLARARTPRLERIQVFLLNAALLQRHVQQRAVVRQCAVRDARAFERFLRLLELV